MLISWVSGEVELRGIWGIGEVSVFIPIAGHKYLKLKN